MFGMAEFCQTTQGHIVTLFFLAGIWLDSCILSGCTFKQDSEKFIYRTFACFLKFCV